MVNLIVAEGVGGIDKVVTGKVIDWNDQYLEAQDLVRDKIVYIKEDLPFYRAAFLADGGVKAVIMAGGGKNYHPLILFNDAKVPAIAGIGEVDLEGKNVTVDSGAGIIYEGEIDIKQKESILDIPETRIKVYVNVGYPSAIKSAAKTGADGIGLLRTEFPIARSMSKILNRELYEGITVKEAITSSNEADVIYAISTHKELREHLKSELKNTIKEAMAHFGKKEIIVRTLDIPREANESMGNRGIRRCIAEGGHTITLIAETIKESLEESEGDYNIGIILPLVSHFSQIETAFDMILDAGLNLKRNGEQDKFGILYGWEIEQPAASENNEIWLSAFQAKYGVPPHYIGIGTNDLTQFTMALGRDIYSKENDLEIKNYLEKLYDESDFSVIKQISEVSKQCKKSGTRLYLLGQAVTNPNYARLMLSFGITPSVQIKNVRQVKQIAHDFEKSGNPKDIISKYVEEICNQYSKNARDSIRSKLLQILDVG